MTSSDIVYIDPDNTIQIQNIDTIENIPEPRSFKRPSPESIESCNKNKKMKYSTKHPFRDEENVMMDKNNPDVITTEDPTYKRKFSILRSICCCYC
jgi:hypothetical protein|tara:strand:+ start:191 stop:478 length:288 start_codon:yes stop_codon:yes gene_type:complete